MGSSKKAPAKGATGGAASTKAPSRRDDPKISRSEEEGLRIGSEQEVGSRLLGILKEDSGSMPVCTEGNLWEYRSKTGLWSPIPQDELHRIVGQFDGCEYPDGRVTKLLKISNAFATGAIRRAEIQVTRADFFTEEKSSSLLVFKNGAVKISPSFKPELLDHSPEHRSRAGYPFDYDPGATAPRFEQMLNEHFSKDSDAKEKIACLQEFFGACLFGLATNKQKCLALPSDGGSGRSTMLEIIERAMPTGSVAHVEAKELRKPERRAKLPGKRLNFSDEVPPDAFLESEDFKKIVVGNTVTAEEKYSPSFEFRPIAGLVFPIQVSASAELSDAFFRRFIIIRYNRSFEGDKARDYNLATTVIESELQGVVTWMIQGAARLLKNDKYTIPPSHSEEELKWKLHADTVRAFLDDKYTKAKFKEPKDAGYDEYGKPNGENKEQHDWVTSSKLYADYQEWCGENGHRKPVAIQEFKRRVEKIGYPMKHTYKGNFFGLQTIDAAMKKLMEAYEKKKKKGTGGLRPPEGPLGAVTILNQPKLSAVK
jgi:putative DNA primase/helicase